MNRVLLSFVGISSILALSAAACGSSSTGNEQQTTGNDAGSSTDDGGATQEAAAPPVDAGPDVDNGAPSTNYPAPHPPLPTLEAFGGPVLQNPKVHLIFYPGYEYTSQMQDFAQKIGELPDAGGETSYWTAVGSEYGVNALQYVGSTVLSAEAGAAPATITDQQIDSFINAEISAGTFGTPDPNTIYTIVYPQSTTITMSGGPTGGTSSSCTSFGGYHSDTTIGSQDYAYAVIPTCPNFLPAPAQPIDSLTGATSHEWLEASTDPYPNTHPAYAQVDENHIAWELVLGGGEAGDLCAQNADAFYKDPTIGYTVQRTWSNELAKASHDPCAPDPAGVAFFDSAPVLTQSVTFTAFGQTIPTQGVKIPVGSSKTIEVDLFSDAATSTGDGGTSGAWTVKALDALELYGQPVTLGFKWDRTTGVNGEKLHLTVTVNKANAAYGGAHPFVIESRLGNTVRWWPAVIVE